MKSWEIVKDIAHNYLLLQKNNIKDGCFLPMHMQSFVVGLSVVSMLTLVARQKGIVPLGTRCDTILLSRVLLGVTLRPMPSQAIIQYTYVPDCYVMLCNICC